MIFSMYKSGSKRYFFLFVLLFSVHYSYAQEDTLVPTAREHVNYLCSDDLAGRGYNPVSGNKKAAEYIRQHFISRGLESPKDVSAYFQNFEFPLSLAQDASLSVNGCELVLGRDYIVAEISGDGTFEGKLKDVEYGMPYQMPKSAKGRAWLFRSGIDPALDDNPDEKKKYVNYLRDQLKLKTAEKKGAQAILISRDKLTASYSTEAMGVPVVYVLDSVLPSKLKSVKLSVTKPDVKVWSQNVIGVIRGNQQPDSVIVVCAHYDHMGKQGEAIFPGANDNASGTSMLLSMVDHYSRPENKPAYTMMFIAFGAEEVGLIGSMHYVHKDPVVPLEKMSFILNLDLMGNGDEGIMAVGGKDFPDKLQIMRDLNDSLQCVPAIRERHNAANSDHYFFLENGVEGFFIFTLGGPPFYHDIYDNAENLRFSNYVKVRKLMIAFLDAIQK